MSSESGLDTSRFIRILTLIVFVTAVFILLAAQELDGILFQVGVFGIGTVGAITTIVGLLISAGRAFDDTAI